MRLYHCMNCSCLLSYNLINMSLLECAMSCKKSSRQFPILQKNEPKLFIFSFLWDPPLKNWFGCALYSIFIFYFKKKSGFEYRKWIQLFCVFVFYKYEYIDIFVNIMKTKCYFFFLSDVMCESEKIYFKKK